MTTRRSGFGSELGRSMIEMLGVLAIVGVLSVGGISGFQKAMNKHKINQVTEELSQFINDFLRYTKDWRRLLALNNGKNTVLSSEVDFFMPTHWRRNGTNFYDSMGNLMKVVVSTDGHISNKYFRVEYHFTKTADKTNVDLCMALYEMAKPLADTIRSVRICNQNSDGSDFASSTMGNAFCGGGVRCLKDLTLEETRQRCSIFFKAYDKLNSINFYFMI